MSVLGGKTAIDNLKDDVNKLFDSRCELVDASHINAAGISGERAVGSVPVSVVLEALLSELGYRATIYGLKRIP